MPNYQYECDFCSHMFDIFQSMLDKKLRKCPECGKNRLHRLIGTGSGIIFKGSGFYETDYKRKSPGSAGKTADTGSSSDKAAETQPVTKTVSADKKDKNKAVQTA